MSKVILTLTFLIISNTFMTLAWYGNLKLQEMKLISSNTPLYLIILLSWGIALLEYSFLIPANRIGSEINGGPFSLVQLKVIQEVVSCIIFGIIVSVLFKGESLQWNHIVAFLLLALAVYFVFMK
ncbi:MAG: DMT family protein [Bacteroidaceae bacterium]|nr:DMT family protein [Bacteroidaceae bacterium]